MEPELTGGGVGWGEGFFPGSWGSGEGATSDRYAALRFFDLKRFALRVGANQFFSSDMFLL